MDPNKHKLFKQRMQLLKLYKQDNPDKGYWDWRNSLPDYLRYTSDSEYDMYAAYKSGAEPEYSNKDRRYHLPTRDPETGYILKKSIHPTYWIGLTKDIKLGYTPYFMGNDTYTVNPKYDEIPSFEGGGVKQDDGEDQSRKWLRHWLRNRNALMLNTIELYKSNLKYNNDLIDNPLSHMG